MRYRIGGAKGQFRVSDPSDLFENEVEIHGFIATLDQEMTDQCNPDIEDPEEICRVFSFIDNRGVKVLYGPDWPPWEDNLTCDSCGSWWVGPREANKHDGHQCGGDKTLGRNNPLFHGRKPQRRCSDEAITDDLDYDTTPVWPADYFGGNGWFTKIFREVVE